MPNDLAVITNSETERQAQTYLPLVEVAATIGVEPTTVRRWIWKGDVHARERSEGRGCEVNVTTLPAKYQPLFIARTTPPRPALRAAAEDEAVSRYAAAPRASVRERAELRLEALLSFRTARAKREQGETFAAVEERWLRNFRRTHPHMKVSIRSVKAWDAAYREGGKSIDALVDFDGEARTDSGGALLLDVSGTPVSLPFENGTATLQLDLYASASIAQQPPYFCDARMEPFEIEVTL